MSRPPRLESSTYIETRPFFLTLCTDRRQPWFARPAVVELVGLQFLHIVSRENIELLAYCFMPDHLHLLAGGCQSGADIRRFVSLAKQHSGYAFARQFRTRLWQDGYYDRALRDDEPVDGVVAYIVDNPVRAGLVERAESYPHWGSARWTRAEILEFVQITRRRP